MKNKLELVSTLCGAVETIGPSLISTTCAKSSNDSVTELVSSANGKATVQHKSKTAVTKRSWKKPKGKPKRPLTAYNIFFRFERQNILLSTPSPISNLSGTKHRKRRNRPEPHGKVRFEDLAKKIGTKWKSLDPSSREKFVALAVADKQRYEREVESWNANRKVKENAQVNSSLNTSESMNPHDQAANKVISLASTTREDACSSSLPVLEDSFSSDAFEPIKLESTLTSLYQKSFVFSLMSCSKTVSAMMLLSQQSLRGQPIPRISKCLLFSLMTRLPQFQTTATVGCRDKASLVVKGRMEIILATKEVNMILILC